MRTILARAALFLALLVPVAAAAAQPLASCCPMPGCNSDHCPLCHHPAA